MDPEDLEEDDIETQNMGDEDDEDDQDDESGDDQDEEDNQDDESGDAEDDSEADDEPVEPRKKGSAQDRIAELAKKRREAESAAFEAELKVADLQKRLESLEAAKPSEAPKPPDPADFKYGEVDSAYLDALVDYKVSMRSADARKEAAEAAEQAEFDRLNAHYAERVMKGMTEGKKRFKDFEEVVNSVTFEPMLARAILDSERAVDIAYHLGNNIRELRDLTRMSPAERARVIGRLEERFSAASAVKKRKSSAPEPLGSSKIATSKHEALYGPGGSQDDFDDAFYGRSKR